MHNWFFIGALPTLPWAKRPVGNVLRDEAGNTEPIARDAAISLMKRAKKKTRRQYAKGLLFDSRVDGFDPLQFKHIIRRPCKQGQLNVPYSGRRFIAQLESSNKPGVYNSYVAVAYPEGSAPLSTRPAREACHMLTAVHSLPLCFHTCCNPTDS